MNSSQILGIAPSALSVESSFYMRRKHIPKPNKWGFNSGVLVMNLTRMRAVRFTDQIEPIVRQYKKWISRLVDQDFLIIYFSQHPDRYLELSCRWNYLRYHCWGDPMLCQSAHESGVGLIHGSGKTFSTNRLPTFRAVYTVFREYDTHTQNISDLISALSHKLNQLKHKHCAKFPEIYTKNL